MNKIQDNTIQKKANPVICVLTNWIRPVYKYEIISGIEEEALKNHLNVIYYLAHNLREVDMFNKYQDAICMLFDKDCIDYLVFLPGLLEIIPRDAIKAFLGRAFPIPLLTINFQLDGFPAVIVDNKEGFRNMIRHMIIEHGKIKLAFVKGLSYNFDAQERFAVFQEVLVEYGMPLQDELLADGDFTDVAGRQAVITFIDKRGLKPGRDFDCIIAANDIMAVGVMRELAFRNISIPGVIAIGGFDDIESAKYQDIPITTVCLPNKELGREAVRHITGSAGPERVHKIPARMIIRKSCGCNSSPGNPAGITIPGQENNKQQEKQLVYPGDNQVRVYFLQNLERIMAGNLPEEINRQLADALVDAFIELWNTKNDKSFLEKLRWVLTISSRYDKEVSLWNNALILFSDWLMTVQPADPQIKKIRTVIDDGFVEITNFIIKENTKEAIDLDNYTEKIRDAGESIKITPEFDQFLTIISESLVRLGFQSFYLFQYHRPDVFSGDYKAILAFSEKSRLSIPENECLYQNFSRIFMQFLKRQHPVAYCISPVFNNNVLFGFIITNKTSDRFERLVYDELTSQINNALKGSRLLIETKEASTELARINMNLQHTEIELQNEISAAAKLQTCLIPRRMSIPGMELAARMMIAHPAGGDYYDVVRAGGKDWIIIGDIAGHGVYTNLVMMMVQTSIRIILGQQPGITPHRLIILVNEVVMSNTRKLGDSEFMKLAVFIHHADGLFTFTGYHLPLLVYRSREAIVECPELRTGITAGSRPGARDEAVLTLDEGDCLLLYTDGVIKARRKRKEGSPYSIERLSTVLLNNGDAPASDIIAAAAGELAGYSCQDDITVLAIKRCYTEAPAGKSS